MTSIADCKRNLAELDRVRGYVRSKLQSLDIYTGDFGRPPPLLDALTKAAQLPGVVARCQGDLPVAWIRLDSHLGLIRNADKTLGTLTEALRNFDREILAQIRTGTRRLVLDCSHEGRPGKPPIFEGIERSLSEVGLDKSNVMVLSQNVAAQTLPEARGKERENSLSLSVTAAHFHLLFFWLKAMNSQESGLPPVGFGAQPTGTRCHRYVSLNYSARPHRALLVTRLRDQTASGYLSFSTERYRGSYDLEKLLSGVRQLSQPDQYHSNVARVRKLFAEHFESDTDLGSMTSQQAVYTMPVEALEQAEMFLVTESEMANATLRRFTEKTLKAILAGIPFVIFGNVGTVDLMRETGFDVFDGIVDHGYDLCEDPADRFEAAWAESCRLLAQSPGLVDRHRARIYAANVANAITFRELAPERWSIRPLDIVVDWLRSNPLSSERAA